MPLVADGAEGDFLTDVQDVVADTLKVGEHLGVEHTALVRAGAGLHPVDLSLAEIFGHVVDLLLDLLDFLDVAAVLLDTQHHIQRQTSFIWPICLMTSAEKLICFS